MFRRLTDTRGLRVSFIRQAVSPPGKSDLADASDREMRITRVKQSLNECLEELQALGLTLPAALLDNAIAEIR